MKGPFWLRVTGHSLSHRKHGYKSQKQLVTLYLQSMHSGQEVGPGYEHSRPSPSDLLRLHLLKIPQPSQTVLSTGITGQPGQPMWQVSGGRQWGKTLASVCTGVYTHMHMQIAPY